MTTFQRRLLKILGVIFIGFSPIIFLQLKFLIFSDRVKLDGRRGEVFGTLFSASTIYSTDYSHKKFLSIKPGMTEKEVVKILGEPIDKFNPYPGSKDSVFTVGFRYAVGSDLNAHYRLRIIYLRNNVVTRRLSKFYYVD